jgi:protocatechuate 3,4-dioxygenase beta subunit
MSRTAPTLETLRDGEGPPPPYLYPDYRSTQLRAPKRPLLLLPYASELTGPVYGDESVGELDYDLTRQHEGEPRESGSSSPPSHRRRRTPVRSTLIEIWQANAAGRY